MRQKRRKFIQNTLPSSRPRRRCGRTTGQLHQTNKQKIADSHHIVTVSYVPFRGPSITHWPWIFECISWMTVTIRGGMKEEADETGAGRASTLLSRGLKNQREKKKERKQNLRNLGSGTQHRQKKGDEGEK